MATYLELFTLKSDSALQDRTAVAVAIKAQGLLDSATPSIAQVTWANEALENPVSKAGALLNYVLAANNGLTVAQIQSASDSALQTNVGAAADIIISGGV